MARARTRERLLEALLGHEPAPLDGFAEVLRIPASSIDSSLPHEVQSRAVKEIVNESLERRAGATLQELSNEIGLQPPTVLAHLRKLEQEGWVRRDERQGRLAYRLNPCFQGQWSDPKVGVFLRWRSARGIDWRFPFVSRLPDLPAQSVLLRFLMETKDAMRMLDDTDVPDMSFVAYGSCARGQARPGSDLDLVVFSLGTVPRELVKAMRGIILESSLWAERPIQLQVLTISEWEKVPVPLRDAILRDGMTVHFESETPQMIESPFWRMLLASNLAGKGKA